MTTGIKIWLWIILILNIISTFTIFSFFGILSDPKLEIVLVLVLLLQILLVISICIMLFFQKIIGFYIMCICAVVICIANIVLGNNPLMALLSAIIVPGITLLFLSNNSKEFS